MSCFLVLIFVRKFEHFCGTGSAFANVSSIPNENKALLEFRDGLIDLLNWPLSWIGEDRCPWKGVVCSRTSGHVIKLDLRNQFQLDELGIPYFDFYPGNYSSVFLKAKVPVHLGNPSSLQYLDLGTFSAFYAPSNFLTSDNLQWTFTLSSLQYVDLSGANLPKDNKWLHSINMLPSLLELHFIPLKTFKYSSVSQNPIPASLGRLSSLIQLSLGLDHLNGSIPKSFGLLSNLEVLDVSDNKLGGMVFRPTWVPPFQLQGEKLSIHYNEFDGEIPLEFGHLSQLRVLNLAQSRIAGTLLRCFINFSAMIGEARKCEHWL
ncbi:hypothetical protein POTOM_037939 [Populus tomentosa]|uniref:Leucine-rich repeat-containing N-terminal plant-type domain-containing protein n=1 Tax=Populus tomentosa TaxID=118781 RepID=A0A8X7YUR5_POPTO|nr:hypothetical protein POTOM_037939 [Populus tomentosa]